MIFLLTELREDFLNTDSYDNRCFLISLEGLGLLFPMRYYPNIPSIFTNRP